MPSAPCIFQFQVHLVWLQPAAGSWNRGRAQTVPNHRNRSKSCGWEGEGLQRQLRGLWASGRSTLGPLYCGRGFWEGKSEHLMNVGSIQHTFSPTNGYYVHLHSVQSLWESLQGNWRPAGRGLHPLRTPKRVGNTDPQAVYTATKCQLLLTCNALGWVHWSLGQ